MDASNRTSPDHLNSTKRINDAGNDKMASPTLSLKDRQQPDEHELQIMEVEGASMKKVQEEPVIIELNDDSSDENNAPLTSEQHTNLDAAANQNTEMSTKDSLEEISPKKEVISDMESNHSYNQRDPMGLLRRIDSQQQVDTNNADVDDDEEEDDEETDLEVDVYGDSNSSSASHGGSDTERWHSWMKRWPWLLHEESDGDFVFCLYCNVVINVNRHISYVQQHNLSLYHQERENNYVSFKNSEKQTDDMETEVKNEPGSNEYIVAMKKRRADEAESLNNFNWERWLKWHPWLERFQSSGTIGHCKCCKISMNVEFVYLRKRHEMSKGHREAMRQQESGTSRKRKRSPSPLDETSVIDPERRSSSNSAKKQAEEAVVVAAVDSGVETTDPSDWCELLPDTTPQQCRCTLCDCRMAISSFMRHLKTKVHCNNLHTQKRNSLLRLDRGVWAQYAEQHPWIVADPNDPTLAYCHVCCRRFMYGHSEIKRKAHENSEKHRAAAAAAGAAEVIEVPNEARVEQEQSEAEDFSAQTESFVGSDEDYVEADARLSTVKPNPVNNTESANTKRKAKPLVRHYSWLRYSKDRKVQLCKYCRVRFRNESSKLRHDQSSEHKKLMHQFKELQATRRQHAEQQRKSTNNEEEESNNDFAAPSVEAEAKTTTTPTGKRKKKAANRLPATIQGKVMIWKERFPWLSYKRNEQRSNYGWCKLCEVSVFIPSFKFASKHQRSARHIRLRVERKRSLKLASAGSVSMAAATAAALATGEAKHKAAMAELQAKYNWLEADAIDENHCHCKICDTRLPIKVFYLRQHDGSRKHAEHMERLRNSKETAPTVAAPVEQPQEIVLEVDQDSDGELSVKSECSTLDQSGSKRSRRSGEMRRVLRVLRDSIGKRNEERNQIDMAFDIVHRLRTLERETEAQPAVPVPEQRVANTTVAPPRDTIDLFLDSISQTLKSLPADLAAEGKVKIMQIVCHLELRSMRRTMTTTSTTTTSKQTDDVAMETTENVTPPSENSTEVQLPSIETIEVIPDLPEPESSSEAVDEPFYEVPAHLRWPRRSTTDATSHLSEIILTTAPRFSKIPDTPTRTTVSKATTTSTSTATSGAALVSTGSPKEVPINIRHILPSTVQVGSKSDQLEKVRMVPIEKLTTPVSNQNININNARNSANVANSNSQPQKHSDNRSSSSSSQGSSETSNGVKNYAALFHLTNGSGTKIITYQRSQNTTQDQHKTSPVKLQQQQTSKQQHSPKQQQESQQQQKQINKHVTNQTVRYSITKSTATLTPNQSQSKAQLQAQAQLLAQTTQRNLLRQPPAHRPSQS